MDSKMQSLQQPMMGKIGERAGIARRSTRSGDGVGLYANFVGRYVHQQSVSKLY